MQVHYHRNGNEELDQTRLGLHFAKEPVTDELHYMALFNFTFFFETGQFPSESHSTGRHSA